MDKKWNETFLRSDESDDASGITRFLIYYLIAKNNSDRKTEETIVACIIICQFFIHKDVRKNKYRGPYHVLRS